MNKQALLLILLLLPGLAIAQHSEIGVHFGGSYYLGDVNPTRHFYNPKTSQGITYRHNLNVRWALRLNVINTTIQGSDADFSADYMQQRGHSFSTQLNDFTAQMEFNFFPAWYEGKYNKLTPYVALGFGMLYHDKGKPSSMLPILPVGVGGKLYISKKITANISWNIRMTYSDYLDQLENPYNEPNSVDSAAKQQTFQRNKDLYSVFGIMFTYRIFNNKHICPAYGNLH